MYSFIDFQVSFYGTFINGHFLTTANTISRPNPLSTLHNSIWPKTILAKVALKFNFVLRIAAMEGENYAEVKIANFPITHLPEMY